MSGMGSEGGVGRRGMVGGMPTLRAVVQPRWVARGGDVGRAFCPPWYRGRVVGRMPTLRVPGFFKSHTRKQFFKNQKHYYLKPKKIIQYCRNQRHVLICIYESN